MTDKNKKTNGTFLIVLMCVATFMFLDMYDTVYNSYSIKAEQYLSTEQDDNTTEDIEKSEFELMKAEVAEVAELLELDTTNVSKISDSEYFKYKNTSEKIYIETLERLQESDRCEVIDNGIDGYTWYITFRLEESTDDSN